MIVSPHFLEVGGEVRVLRSFETIFGGLWFRVNDRATTRLVFLSMSAGTSSSPAFVDPSNVFFGCPSSLSHCLFLCLTDTGVITSTALNRIDNVGLHVFRPGILVSVEVLCFSLDALSTPTGSTNEHEDGCTVGADQINRVFIDKGSSGREVSLYSAHPLSFSHLF